ncbi:BFD-like 2Fe-2S binding domain protein [Asticcacaulis biprosthecium C19]|uniref:Bacterioferritin-associated ferredoxin n=1 Tax=Asticcacaulis biprosthecium C19 TaxID=715226 RepID=F4QP86_9CAUL|nr:(2Fe-2S)-binding protein [Asticcacaulis biprosthecium]EGF91144.1 BFD-like 2Fe-2S binding domain protein [Asticcacaulis biprosthecium C19]
MYVCNCNGIRERDVNAAISSGASTPKQVFDHAGCRPQCARCVCEMREMIDDAQVSLSMAAE